MPPQPQPAAQSLRQRMVNAAGGQALIHWMIADPNGVVQSGGLPGGKPGEPFGPGRYSVACDPTGAVRHVGNFSASGETSAVTCPACMKHERFAPEYQPHPSVKGYADIPAAHLAVIESWEKANGVGPDVTLAAQVAPEPPPEPCTNC